MDIVGVHGIAQQQVGRNQLRADWLAAAADGVERVTGYPAPGVEMDIAFYGDLFLPRSDGSKSSADPLADVDPDEADFLTEFAVERVGQAAAVDVVRELDGQKGRVPRVLRTPLALLAGGADLVVATKRVGVLRQVWRYQNDDDLASAVRTRVREVASHCRVLIGHSLGSIVAAECVLLGDVPTPDVLVTLGSPLGTRTVGKRLRADLSGITTRRWANIYDPGDIVAAAGGLARFGAADAVVDNGNSPHSVERYLGKFETGREIMRDRAGS